MSYDTDSRVWVGDLDDHVNIDAISRANKMEEDEYAMEADLDGLGDISLFSNQTISTQKIHSRGVSPEQWRWMLHRAEKSLGQMDTPDDIEKAFIRTTMSGMRRYAVARYAGFEGLLFTDAITAIYPHGIRALLFSYMAGEQLLSNRSYRKEIQRNLHLAASTPNLTAYDRAGLVRRCLHDLVIDEEGRSTHLKLEKVRMRNILSLLRLHFSNLECQVQSVAELLEMQLRYEAARAAEKQGFDTSQKITGMKVQNWRLRSLQPLTFYFPYSVRHAFKRLMDQDPSRAGSMDQKTAANELALTYCEIELMRLRGREKANKRG